MAPSGVRMSCDIVLKEAVLPQLPLPFLLDDAEAQDDLSVEGLVEDEEDVDRGGVAVEDAHDVAAEVLDAPVDEALDVGKAEGLAEVVGAGGVKQLLHLVEEELVGARLRHCLPHLAAALEHLVGPLPPVDAVECVVEAAYDLQRLGQTAFLAVGPSVPDDEGDDHDEAQDEDEGEEGVEVVQVAEDLVDGDGDDRVPSACQPAVVEVAPEAVDADDAVGVGVVAGLQPLHQGMGVVVELVDCEARLPVGVEGDQGACLVDDEDARAFVQAVKGGAEAQVVQWDDAGGYCLAVCRGA